MSKRKHRKSPQLNPAPRVTRRAVLLVGLLITSSLVASGIFAGRGFVQSLKKAKKDSQMQPQAAGSPTKEYVFAGGRLIATDEPPGTTLLAPTNLVATTASVSSVNLTWVDPNSPATNSYIVERTPNIGSSFVQIGTPSSQSFTDSGSVGGISASTTYIYRVRAASGTNQSQPSNVD